MYQKNIPSRKPKTIAPLPREPLTQKARGAIEMFVTLEGRKRGMYLMVLTNACLKAERMRRVQLYAYLEGKGYAWKPKAGLWMPKTKPTLE